MKFITKRFFLAVLLLMVFSIGCSKDEASTDEPTTTTPEESDFKEVLVQPIIITNDQGTGSFYDIDLDKINRAYSNAKVKFVLLKSKSVQNNAIYEGTMGLDEMKEWLSKNNHLVGERNIVNLVCTENLAGSGGPIGRAETPGSITFIAFDSNKGSILNVFVVSHEVGHNFGLVHADQDNNVPNDVPNVMGDGDYNDRLDPKNSFNDYQIDIINKAAIVHTKEKANELINKYNLTLN